jgi:hypothetical protein
MTIYEKQIADVKSSLTAKISGANISVINNDPNLKIIADTILSSIAKNQVDDSYGGGFSHNDGAMSIKMLNAFVDGFRLAKDENDLLSGCYSYILEKYRLTKDVDYDKYIALKEKFEKIK